MLSYKPFFECQGRLLYANVCFVQEERHREQKEQEQQKQRRLHPKQKLEEKEVQEEDLEEEEKTQAQREQAEQTELFRELERLKREREEQAVKLQLERR